MLDKILDSFFLGFTGTDISISSYRLESFVNSFQYILKYPLLGMLSGEQFIGIKPHNYFIYKLLQYGFLFSIPFIIFIFFLGIQSFKMLFYISSSKNFLIGLMFIYTIIISMFEYAFPFLPGTTHLLFWIVLGMYEKERTYISKLM